MSDLTLVPYLSFNLSFYQCPKCLHDTRTAAVHVGHVGYIESHLHQTCMRCQPLSGGDDE